MTWKYCLCSWQCLSHNHAESNGSQLNNQYGLFSLKLPLGWNSILVSNEEALYLSWSLRTSLWFFLIMILRCEFKILAFNIMDKLLHCTSFTNSNKSLQIITHILRGKPLDKSWHQPIYQQILQQKVGRIQTGRQTQDSPLRRWLQNDIRSNVWDSWAL